MPAKKSIDEELEDLTTIYQRGGGIGEPDLKEEIGRRIDFPVKRGCFQPVRQR